MAAVWSSSCRWNSRVMSGLYTLYEICSVFYFCCHLTRSTCWWTTWACAKSLLLRAKWTSFSWGHRVTASFGSSWPGNPCSAFATPCFSIYFELRGLNSFSSSAHSPFAERRCLTAPWCTLASRLFYLVAQSSFPDSDCHWGFPSGPSARHFCVPAQIFVVPDHDSSTKA